MMDSNVVPIATAAEERAWRRYCEARERAQRSNSIIDGIAAGRAWAEWLALFEQAKEVARAPP